MYLWPSKHYLAIGTQRDFLKYSFFFFFLNTNPVCFTITDSNEVQEIMTDYDKKYRGRELPGVINFKVFEKFIQDQVMEQEKPAVNTLRAVRSKN